MRRATIIAAVLLAAGSGLWAQTDDEDAKAIATFPLTMEGVDKALRASAILSKLQRNDTALSQEVAEIAREPRLKDQVKRLEANPKLMAPLRSYSLSAREFFLILKGLAAARLASGMPPKLPHPTASDEHIKFYRDHEDEIDALEENLAPEPSPTPSPKSL